MNVLLIHPTSSSEFIDKVFMHEPLALEYLGAGLKADGHHATVRPADFNDAAFDLFNEKGTGAVTTNPIAAAAGIIPGNLYDHFHFRNSEDILRAIFEKMAAAASKSRRKWLKRGRQAPSRGSSGPSSASRSSRGATASSSGSFRSW